VSFPFPQAYAKLHGSYNALVSGNPSDALADLTGCPTAYYNFKADEIAAAIASGALWDKMCEHSDAQLLMAAGSKGQDTFTEQGTVPENDAGLVPGHAYTILHCQEGANGEKLMQMRNPWGSFEWKGEWSDNSPLWTDAAIAEFGAEFNGDDDGVFWMSWDAFLQYFDSINVCFTSSSDGLAFHRATADAQFTKTADGAACSQHATFTLAEPANVFAAVHQQDTRVVGAAEYLEMGVMILDADGGV
jgi:calpain-15